MLEHGHYCITIGYCYLTSPLCQIRVANFSSKRGGSVPPSSASKKANTLSSTAIAGHLENLSSKSIGERCYSWKLLCKLEEEGAERGIPDEAWLAAVANQSHGLSLFLEENEGEGGDMEAWSDAAHGFLTLMRYIRPSRQLMSHTCKAAFIPSRHAE